MAIRSPITNEQAAALLGVTVEQIRRQHAATLPGLERMLARAEATGRKVRGYTAGELRARVADCRERAGL